METLNKMNFAPEGVDKKEQEVNNITDHYKNLVKENISDEMKEVYETTKALSETFALNEKQEAVYANELMKIASENMEVSMDEAKLAIKLGKYNEMMELVKQPLSLASVMDDLENYVYDHEEKELIAA